MCAPPHPPHQDHRLPPPHVAASGERISTRAKKPTAGSRCASRRRQPRSPRCRARFETMAFAGSYSFPHLAPSALDPAWFASVEHEACDVLASQEEAYEAEVCVSSRPAL